MKQIFFLHCNILYCMLSFKHFQLNMIHLSSSSSLAADPHEDHAGSHVQASNRTGDAVVHMNDGQEALSRTNGLLWFHLTVQTTNRLFTGRRMIPPCPFISPVFISLG